MSNAPRGSSAAALCALALLSACSNGGPAASAPSASSAGTVVNVALTPTGCAPDPATVPAGYVMFNVTNQGADAVSELELKRGEATVAEKENLTPGLSGSFSARLDPGTYVLECPGATTAESEFTVTE